MASCSAPSLCKSSCRCWCGPRAHIGHVAIRNRGTLGGSLAYADPAAELPACAVALGATLVLGSLAGEREVKAEDFFKGLFETDLRPGELIVAVKFPVDAGGNIDRLRRAVAPARRFRAGRLGRGGHHAARAGSATARLVYFGCVDRAKLAQSVSAAVAGHGDAVAGLRPRSSSAIRQDLTPDDTPGLRADTRLHMATVLTRRVLNSLI